MNELRHQEREEMKALTRKLADAQATVEALQRERDELKELTSVICGHCCEPMAIPSRAVLQAALDATSQEGQHGQ